MRKYNKEIGIEKGHISTIALNEGRRKVFEDAFPNLRKGAKSVSYTPTPSQKKFIESLNLWKGNSETLEMILRRFRDIVPEIVCLSVGGKIATLISYAMLEIKEGFRFREERRKEIDFSLLWQKLESLRKIIEKEFSEERKEEINPILCKLFSYLNLMMEEKKNEECHSKHK